MKVWWPRAEMLLFEAGVAILNPTIDHKTFSIEKSSSCD